MDDSFFTVTERDITMPRQLSQPDSINVLISDTNWAWPQAVAEIFQPRGINALVAASTDDAVGLVRNNKIHLALVDSTVEESQGLKTLQAIRRQDNLLPCILLAQEPNERLLGRALALNAFSVLAKPVDLSLLAAHIDRVFTKQYASNVFSSMVNKMKTQPVSNPAGRYSIKKTVIRWTIRKNERNEH